MAFLTKDRALKARRRQIRNAVNEYHQQLLMELESKKMDELGRRTIREAMEKENRRMVAATVRHWEESISGKLRAAHYRLLVAATTQHLMLIDKALTEVEAGRQAEHEFPVH
jgi:predicted enzyme involved in methoxymalonyl-ACP biosynthesis